MLFAKNIESLIKVIDSSAVILFAVVCFSAYLIPLWYAFCVSHPLFYVNAWDDANYFTYQMALGVRNTPGYYDLYLVSWLESLGITGATQNFIFETLLIPLTALFIYKVFIMVGKTKIQSLFYTVCILFSSVLFNYSNTHVANYFGSPHILNIIAYGWETYPSVIRAPNPLFSYFLVSFFVYLYFKLDKKLILLLPIPFLYYYVLLPYVYLLIIYYTNNLLNNENKNIRNTIMPNLAAFVLLAAMVYIGFDLIKNLVYGSSMIKLEGSRYYSTERHFYLPLVGLFGLGVYLFLKICGLFKNKKTQEMFFITVVLCCFFITNLQLLTGFSLEIKSYQDYSCSILGGILIVLLFETLDVSNNVIHYRKILLSITFFIKIVLIFYITRYVLLSQNFSFINYNFEINLGPQFTRQQLENIKNDPLHAIVIGSDASQKIPYALANIVAPVISYQYSYPPIMNQCKYNYFLINNALNFVNKNYPKKSLINLDIDNRIKKILNSINQYKSLPYFDKGYCQYNKYNSDNFIIVIPKQEDVIRFFPDWSLLLSRVTNQSNY